MKLLRTASAPRTNAGRPIATEHCHKNRIGLNEHGASMRHTGSTEQQRQPSKKQSGRPYQGEKKHGRQKEPHLGGRGPIVAIVANVTRE